LNPADEKGSKFYTLADAGKWNAAQTHKLCGGFFAPQKTPCGFPRHLSVELQSLEKSAAEISNDWKKGN